MSFLDKLFGRTPPPAPAPRVFAVPVIRPFINTPALDAAGLRKGMWVMGMAGLGILTGCRIDGLGEVTLQKPDGTTRMELDENDKAVPMVHTCELDTLRAAYIDEIPESRYEDADQLRALGYITASEA